MNTVTDKMAEYCQITNDYKKVVYELTSEISKRVWKNYEGY